MNKFQFGQYLTLLVFLLMFNAGAYSECGDWGYAQMDFNKDCVVNIKDFAKFCEQWLVCSNPLEQNCQRLNKAKIAAHRGFSSIAPENTLAAFNLARGYADMVELDVHSSADGVLVVMHDANVVRTTDGTGYIYNFTLAELKQLDAGSSKSAAFAGERIPTLEESINAILPDMTPVIEQKGGTAQQYLDLLDAMGVRDKVIVISFTESFLLALHAIAPDIELGFLKSSALDDSKLVSLAVNGISIADISRKGTTQDNVNKIHSVGLKAWAWTVDGTADVQAEIGKGVMGITSNNPQATRQVVEQYY
ncbi:MAG: glycerophosphodiester phosphodiesterase family protein [Phycisphaerales bacterium]